MQSQTYQEPTFMIVISTFARCVAFRRCGTQRTQQAQVWPQRPRHDAPHAPCGYEILAILATHDSRV